MKNNKNILIFLGLVNIILLFLPWLGFSSETAKIGWSCVIRNPLFLIGIVFMVIVIFIPTYRNTITKAGVWLIPISYIYVFLTWHVQTITGEVNLKTSLEAAYPWFFIGLACMLVLAFIMTKLPKQIKTA